MARLDDLVARLRIDTSDLDVAAAKASSSMKDVSRNATASLGTLPDDLGKMGNDAGERLGSGIDDGVILRIKRTTEDIEHELGRAGNAGGKALGDGISRASGPGFDATIRRMNNLGSAITKIGVVTGFAVLAQQALALAAALEPALGILLAIPGAVAVAAGGIGALLVGFSGIGDALKTSAKVSGGAAKDNTAQVRALEQAVKGVASASKAVEDAVKGVAAAQRDVAAAQRGVISALQGVADAQDTVAEATRNIADAQKRSLQAQVSLDDAIQNATKSLKAYDLQLRGAAQSEEDADVARKEAQANLERLLKGGVTDALRLRKARDAVTDAELKYEEAVQNNLDLQDKATKATKAGVEGDAGVVKAREEIANAAQNAEDANKRLAKANDGVVDANQRVVDAQQGVIDAQDAVAEANYRVAQANDGVVEANQRVVDAQKALADSTNGGSAAIDKQAEAMAKLSPAARATVVAILALEGGWRKMQNTVQEALFAGIATEITQLAKASIPTLTVGLSAIAGAFNGVAKSAIDVMKTPVFQGELATILAATATMVSQLGTAVAPLISGLSRLSVAALPLLQRFTDFVTNGLLAAGAFLNTQEGIDKATTAMDKAGDVFSQVYDIAKNLAIAIHNIFGAVDDGSFLTSLVDLTKRFKEFTGSAEGQDKIKQIFDALGKVAEHMLNLFPKVFDIVSSLLTVFDGLPDPVKNLLTDFAALAIVIGPVLSVVSQAASGIKGVTDVVNELGDAKDKIKEFGSDIKGAYEKTKGALDAARNNGVLSASFYTTKIAAVKSGIETARIWLMYQVESIKAAGAMVAARVRIVASWVAMQAAAVVSGIRTAASWALIYGQQAVTAIAQTAIGAARVVASWVLMGVQALAGAARVAAAWLIAIGPIALVIAAVVGVAILIYKNWDTIKEKTAEAWGAVKDAVGGAVDFIVGLFLNFTPVGLVIKHWDDIKQATSDAWTAVKNFVVDGVTGIYNGIKSGLSAVGDFFSRAWNTAVDITKTAFTNLKIAVSNGLNDAVNFITDLPRRVYNGFVNVNTTLFDLGKNLIQGLLDGMNSILKNIGRFMADKLPGALQDPFKKAMGIASPSKVFAEYGRNIGQGLVIGIADTGKQVAASVKGLADITTGAFNPVLPDVNMGGSLAATGNYATGGSTSGGVTFQQTINAVPYTPKQVQDEAMTSLLAMDRKYGKYR